MRHLVISVVVGLALVSGEAPPPGQATPSRTASSAGPSASATQSATTPANPSSASAGPTSVRVYFLTDTPFGMRLATEVRTVSGDPLTGALQAMIEGSVDPDYPSFWNPEAVVESTGVESGVVTVDMSTQVRDAQVDPQTALMLVQQLVFTATSDEPTAKVKLLVEGQAAGRLWGVVSWDDAIGRGDASQVLSPVQLVSPAQNSRLTTDNLSFSGEYLAGTTLTWRVSHAATDDEVATGVVEAAAGDGFADFKVNPELGPGRYILDLRAHRASDPGATPLAIETKEFSVHLAA